MSFDANIIVEGCKRGHEKAQADLYAIYASKMFALCLYYSRDRMAAEDLLQEGFIKVFSCINQLKSTEQLDAWVRRIFVNCALARYRKKNVLKFEVNDESADEEVCRFGDDGECSAIDQITAQELTFMIQSLSPQYQVVFNLYAIDGFSHKEISAMLGISEGTSKSNLSRARAILQERVMAIYHSESKVTAMVR